MLRRCPDLGVAVGEAPRRHVAGVHLEDLLREQVLDSSRATGLCLGISDQTVKVHRRNIYKKLQISSQNELFSLLVENMKGD